MIPLLSRTSYPFVSPYTLACVDNCLYTLLFHDLSLNSIPIHKSHKKKPRDFIRKIMSHKLLWDIEASNKHRYPINEPETVKKRLQDRKMLYDQVCRLENTLLNHWLQNLYVYL